MGHKLPTGKNTLLKIENLQSLVVLTEVFLKGLYWGLFWFFSIMVNDITALDTKPSNQPISSQLSCYGRG